MTPYGIRFIRTLTTGELGALSLDSAFVVAWYSDAWDGSSGTGPHLLVMNIGTGTARDLTFALPKRPEDGKPLASPPPDFVLNPYRLEAYKALAPSLTFSASYAAASDGRTTRAAANGRGRSAPTVSADMPPASPSRPLRFPLQGPPGSR